VTSRVTPANSRLLRSSLLLAIKQARFGARVLGCSSLARLHRGKSVIAYVEKEKRGAWRLCMFRERINVVSFFYFRADSLGYSSRWCVPYEAHAVQSGAERVDPSGVRVYWLEQRDHGVKLLLDNVEPGIDRYLIHFFWAF
jgi:hypothetical protein